MAGIRAKIVDDFAKWTALSALRSGAPIKSKEAIYRLLDKAANHQALFDSTLGPISQEQFDQWHEAAVLRLCEAETGLKEKSQIGWAAKIINVYLKTRVYVACDGREGLALAIHPPIDNGLVQGLKKNFRDRAWAIRSIKGITSYHDHYMPFIRECRQVAKDKDCLLIEVEFYWQWTSS